MTELSRPVTNRDHTHGSPDAPIILVEYGDYECPDCKAAYPIIRTLQAELGDHLGFVYRHFPLIQIHPRAEPAAESAEAAGVQGHFWEMHDILYRYSPSLELQHLVAYAEQIGLDGERVLHEVRGHRYQRRIHADMESGVQSGVNGTPTFFINGARHQGGHDLKSILEAVRVVRA